MFVSPVAAGGVDAVGRDNFPGVDAGDGDGGLVDEGEDADCAVGVADRGVVEASGVADRDPAALVDPVVAEAKHAERAWGCGQRFRGCAIGLAGGLPVAGAVRTLLVVVVPEVIQLGLQLVEGACSWLCAEEAFQGLVEAFDL